MRRVVWVGVGVAITVVVVVRGRQILARYALTEIEVSERDLLHGAAIAAAELPEPVEGLAPPGAYTCC